MMMVLYGMGGLLLLVFLLLLLPIRYVIHFEKWMISCRISVLLGLWHKEISFAKEEEPEEDNEADLWAACLQKAEAAAQDKEIEKESQPPSTPVGKQFFSTPAEEEDEDDHPSVVAQLRFALNNGLLKKGLVAAMHILSHSQPSRWRIEGEFGTGEPMETGVISGMTAAFLPAVTQGIRWNYVDKVMALQGNGKGRIIPLYIVYIALQLLIAKETRQFWHFRQGGIQHG